MGENHFAPAPVALYGGVLFMCAIAYTIMVLTLVGHHGKNSLIAKAVGDDRKGKISLLFYFLGAPLAFVHPALGYSMYVIVAIIWLVPDNRIEKVIAKK